MLRRCACALVLLLFFVGAISAAEYKGKLLAVKAGESITVSLRGEPKTFPIDEKTVIISWYTVKDGARQARVSPALLARHLAKAKKKVVPVAITTREEKGKEVVRALHFDLHNKPAKRPAKDE